MSASNDRAVEIPLRVNLGARSYDIHFDAVETLPLYLDAIDARPGRCLVVSDVNVAAVYEARIAAALENAGWDAVYLTLPAGETTKSIEKLGWIYDMALAKGVDRGTPLIAVGGGVVGDLAGFAAATLLRGLPFVQVPTTLIAQVDSAIGGKTGINHRTGKNLIGAFYQPKFVLADPAVLQSLPEREWTSGLAEVVKHALIRDASLFSFLEENWDAVADRDPDVVAPLVRRAAAVKVGVVEQDERESGLRAILNFGHTFAHAIERVAGYGTFTHGEAVAAGMRAALHLSELVQRGSSSPGSAMPESASAGAMAILDVDRADALVARIPVPSGLSALPLPDLMSAMQHDKKMQSGRLRFVLLDRIGHAYVTADVRERDFEAAWEHMRATDDSGAT